ncbi:hypothetical protein NQZ68_031130 [Dissostichus eleginoides]|nr:hypothetical protein NQZ68_031130 [Dissostichus eleginoides]
MKYFRKIQWFFLQLQCFLIGSLVGLRSQQRQQHDGISTACLGDSSVIRGQRWGGQEPPAAPAASALTPEPRGNDSP